MAFAVGRRVGSAVARNRLRRRLRALASGLVSSQALPAGIYLIGASPQAAGASTEELRVALAGAVATVSR